MNKANECYRLFTESGQEKFCSIAGKSSSIRNSARISTIGQHLTCVQSTWRPLKGPLFDWPLAVGDAQTFDAAHDYQISDVVYPEWTYENVLVHARPGQKWYYFHALEESETMIFKCADSNVQALQGKFHTHGKIEKVVLILHVSACPHGAFCNSAQLASENPRESIESRAFVMWAPLEELPDEVGSVYGERTQTLR